MIEHAIVIRVAEDMGVQPACMWGRFIDGELVYCLAADQRGRARCWTREPRETAEGFEARIVQALMEEAHTAHGRARGLK